MNRWHLLFVTILLVGSSWIWLNRVPAVAALDVRTPQPAVDHPAPNFTLTTLTTESFTLQAAQGKPIVLNFWATWCGPCQRELPALQAAAERYGDEVLILGVDQGESVDLVQSYVDQMGLTFVIPLDSDFAVSGLYNVQGLPTTYFIDRQGVIRQIWMGEMNSITLAEGVAQLLQ